MQSQWLERPLEELLIPRRELVSPSLTGKNRYVGLEHLDSGMARIFRFGNDSTVRSSKNKFYPQDILYGKLRPYLDKGAIAEWEGVCSTDILVFEANNIEADPFFMSFFIHQPEFLEYAIANTDGVNHPRTSWNSLSKYCQKVPPLPEQKAIATVLSKIQFAIEIQDKTIKALKELQAATLSRLLQYGLETFSIRQADIGLLPKPWAIVPMREAMSVKEGLVDPKVEPYASLPHVGPENIEQSTGRLLVCQTAKNQRLISGKYLFNPGEIVYSKIRPYLKKSILADFKGICSADVYPLIPKPGFDSAFLHAVTLSETFSAQAISQQDRTGIPKVNREQLNSIVIPKPSLEEQKEIGKFFHSILNRLQLACQKHFYFNSMFSSMLHQLMTGKIRVNEALEFLQECSDLK